ncbi:MAG: plasmid mobilization protein [Burkholderiaceae bacterium]
MSGTEKRQRTRLKAIRLTPDELAAIEAAAERAGMTVGAYMRSVVLAAPVPRQSRRPPVERRALAQLLGQIGKLGSNVNQLAKYGNVGRLIEDRHGAEAAADIAALRAAVMDALGRGEDGDDGD